jgi:hypothetical protein
MKRNIFVYLIISGALLVACQKEKNDPGETKGKISINLGLFININEVENTLKSTKGVEDFVVTICTSSGQEVIRYDKASEMPSQIELETGQYYVAASSNNDSAAAFNNPYYYGRSANFTIDEGETRTVTVNCEMANTMVSIIYSDNVKNSYSDYRTTVSSSAGSLTFSKDETRAGYFRTLPLSITVNLTWRKTDGTYSLKILTGSIPSPQAKRKYEIHIDAAKAGTSAAVHISLDETTIPVELVQITDKTDTLKTNGMNTGDLLITEIMYDPVSLGDATGEWFEVYNNSGKLADLFHSVISKNGTENHTVNEHMVIPANGYLVLARNNEAVSSDKYVYGSAISLNNTGATTLSLYNYGTNGTDGSLICAVTYGANGFPDGSGASIILSPGHLNSADLSLASSWCVSSSIYNTGDLGTPGLPNDACP